MPVTGKGLRIISGLAFRKRSSRVVRSLEITPAIVPSASQYPIRDFYGINSSAALLTVDSSSHNQTVDSVVLVQHQVADVDNSLQFQSLQNPDLIQHHVVIADNSEQPQNTDELNLTQHHVLSAQNSEQSQESDEVTLSTTLVLSVNNAKQNINVNKPILSVEASGNGKTYTSTRIIPMKIEFPLEEEDEEEYILVAAARMIYEHIAS